MYITTNNSYIILLYYFIVFIVVGTYIGNRSSPQCTSHHFAICSEKQKQGRWSIEEDEVLYTVVLNTCLVGGKSPYC